MTLSLLNTNLKGQIKKNILVFRPEIIEDKGLSYFFRLLAEDELNLTIDKPIAVASKTLTLTGTTILTTGQSPIVISVIENNNDLFYQLKSTLKNRDLAELLELNGIQIDKTGKKFFKLFKPFKTVQLTANTETKQYELLADQSKQSLDIIPEKNIQLKNIGFKFVYYVCPDIGFSHLDNPTLRFFGDVHFGKTIIKAAITAPLGFSATAGMWEFQLQSETTLKQGLHDLAAITGINFTKLFPKGLLKKMISGIVLNDFFMQFYLYPPRISQLTFDISSTATWEITKGLSIQELGFKAIASFGNNAATYLTLYGAIALNKSDPLRIYLEIPFNKEDWKLNFADSKPYGHTLALSDVQQLLLNTPLKDLHLPASFLKEKKIHLSDFEIIFNPLKARFTSIKIDLHFLITHELFAGLTIDQIGMSLSLYNPFKKAKLGKRELQGSINCRLLLENAPLELSASKTINGWYFYGRMDAEETLSAKKLLDNLLKTYTGWTLPPELPDLMLKGINLSLDTETNDLAFGGYSAANIPYTLGKTKLVLFLDIDGVFNPTETQKLSGAFTGGFIFAKNTFSATLGLGTNNILNFIQEKDQVALTLKTFLKELTGKAIALPPEVPDCSIEDLIGEIDFGTKEISFSGNSTIDWDILNNGQPIQANVAIAFGRRLDETSKSYSYQGSLNITSKAALSAIPEIQLSNYNFEFRFDGKNWLIAGSLDASAFERNFALAAGLVSNSTARILALSSKASASTQLIQVGAFQLKQVALEFKLQQNKKTKKSTLTGYIAAKTILAGAKIDIRTQLADTLTFSTKVKNLQLRQLSLQVLGVDLPEELPDIIFKNVDFSLSPANKVFAFEASMVATGLSLNVGTANMNISKAALSASRDVAGKTKFEVTVSGKGQISEDIRFKKYAFTFGYNEGWKLMGTLDSTIFDESFVLQAGYMNQMLWLSYERTNNAPLLSIPDIGSLDVRKVEFGLIRKKKKTYWEFGSTGNLNILNFAKFGGKLELEQNEQGTFFRFKPDDARIIIPLFDIPDGDPIYLEFDFEPIEISRKKLGRKTQWGFEAGVSFSCPNFYKLLPDPIRKVFPMKITTRFIARGKSITISTDRIVDLRVIIPPIELAEGTSIPVGLIRLSLTNLAINLGKELSLSLDFGFGMPSSLNKNFGVKEDGSAFLNIFNTFDENDPEGTTIKLRPIIGTEGVRMILATSPFAFIKFKTEEDKKVWCYADLGDCGAVRFQVPELSLDIKSRSFICNGGFETVKELGIPMNLVKQLFKGANLEDIGALIPDKLPLQEITLLDGNNKLDKAVYTKIFEAVSQQGLPKELDIAFDILAGSVNRLPDHFRKYLKIVIPKSFNFDITITPDNQGVSVKVSVKKGDPPIRLLVPLGGYGIGQIVGIELYSFTLGELFGTNFFLVEMDARLDHFDVITLAASLAVGNNHSMPLPSSNEVSRHLIIEDFFLLIFAGIKVYGIPIPIPIPLFYTELGFEYCGLEGVRTEAHIGFHKPEINFGGMLKSMIDFVKFVSQPKARMNPLALGKMDPKFRIGPTFFQLPAYFGGGHIGVKDGLPLPGAYEAIAQVLNGIKFFSLPETVASIPLHHRLKFEQIKFLDFAIESNWLLLTLSEYRKSPAKMAKRIAGKAKTLSAILPPQEPTAKAKDGIVVFLQGGFSIQHIAQFDSAFALTTIDGQAFATGFHLNGLIGDLFSLKASGSIQIDANRQPLLDLNGKVHLTFLNDTILNGSVRLDSRSGLKISGYLNLFPKSKLIEIKGDVNGYLRKDAIDISGDMRVKFGPHLTLAGATLNINNQEFLIKGTLLNQEIQLALQRKGGAMRFFGTMSPLEIGRILVIEGNSPIGGPIIYLEIGEKDFEAPKMKILPVKNLEPPNKNEWVKVKGDKNWKKGAIESFWKTKSRKISTSPWKNAKGVGTWEQDAAKLWTALPPKPKTVIQPKEKVLTTLLKKHIDTTNYKNWVPSKEPFKFYLSSKVMLLGIENEVEIVFRDNNFSFDLRGNLFSLYECQVHLSGNDILNGDTITAIVRFNQLQSLENAIRDFLNFILSKATDAIDFAKKGVADVTNQINKGLEEVKKELKKQADARMKAINKGINEAKKEVQKTKKAVRVIDQKIQHEKDKFDTGVLKLLKDSHKVATDILNFEKAAIIKIQKDIDKQHAWFANLPWYEKAWNLIGHGLTLAGLEAAKNYIKLTLPIKEKIVADASKALIKGYSELRKLTNSLLGEKGLAQMFLNEAEKKFEQAKDEINNLPEWMKNPGALVIEAGKRVNTGAGKLVQDRLDDTKKLVKDIQKIGANLKVDTSPIRIKSAEFTSKLTNLELKEFQAYISLEYLTIDNKWISKDMHIAIDFGNLPKTAEMLARELLPIPDFKKLNN